MTVIYHYLYAINQFNWIDRISKVTQLIISTVQYVFILYTLYEKNPYLNEILEKLIVCYLFTV